MKQYVHGDGMCCTVPKFLVPGHKNLETVQHFCSSGLQKCCTVPKFLYFHTPDWRVVVFLGRWTVKVL